MAVLRMQRVSICALKKDRKEILEKLQEMGVMQITPILEEDRDFSRTDTSGTVASFRKAASVADRALEALDRYAPEKKSMLSSLMGRTAVGTARYRAVTEKKDSLLKLADRILELDKEKDEHAAAADRLRGRAESLAPWMSLEIPMDFEGTKSTAVLLGTMPPAATREDVCRCLAEKIAHPEAFDIEILNSDKDAIYLCAICLKEDAAAAEEALRAEGFTRPAVVCGKTPAQEKEDIGREIDGHTKRIAQICEEAASYARHREELKIFSDYYRVRADKYEAIGKLPQSRSTFVVSGYAAQKDVGEIRSAIAEKYDCALDAEDIKEDEQAPVILENNRFSSSVEGVLKSYGLPGKGEIDPTAIMSVFYIVFFGLMLSDAAYGLVLALGCFIVQKKFPGMDKALRKNIRMFMYCGISTLFWGVLFGGYFGDAIDVVARTFFHVQVPEGGMIKALWFVPLNNPMRMMMYSLGFGIIHLFIGLGLKGYMLLRDKKYMDFICSVALWYVFLIGLLLMLLPSDIFVSIAQLQPGSIPAVLGKAGKILALVGLVGLVVFTAREKKNIFLRLALGFYEVYNVTGWMSDILSYSRLLALGLATGVIASVVNQMGSMFGGGIAGTLIFIPVFVIGHIFNLAINLLGAYVHTNRLQFVEFFGKFYEGGGREFVPFKSNTKYIEIKEDVNV